MKENLIKSQNKNENNSKKENYSKEGFTVDTYNSMEDFWFSVYMVGEDNKTQQRGLLETLGIDIEGNIISVDTKMPPDIEGKKGSFFDCHLKTTCDKKIIIEVQQNRTSDFEARLLTYGSKMITSSIQKGENYDKAKKAIVIAICDFKFLKSPLYHNIFTINNKNLNIHEELTDKIEIHTLEMPKVRQLPLYNKMKKYLKTKNHKKYMSMSNELEYLLFIDNETSHEMRKEIVKMGNEGIGEAFKKIEEALQDEDTYDIYMTYKIKEMEQKNIMHEREKIKEEKGIKKGMEKGMEKEKIEIATILKNDGHSIEYIAKTTKLNPKIIEKL
ncbi:MAG: Rpn family recombination-promoting nuclease/putative transposase [Methanobrevibacter sp.]|nr:Rpn family recombination-promoting nuclease/putative transposase [Methanobrevibacter sp.]